MCFPHHIRRTNVDILSGQPRRSLGHNTSRPPFSLLLPPSSRRASVDVSS